MKKGEVMNEPTTEAGRALVSDLMDSSKMLGPWQVAERVIAIEQEARANADRELRPEHAPVIDDHFPDASFEMRRGWEAAIQVLLERKS